MPRRLGFWTLLITSTLCAQGCAHTTNSATNNSLANVHKELQGVWLCSSEFSLAPKVKGHIESKMTFSPEQMVEQGTFRIDDQTKEPGFGVFEGEAIDTYSLINDSSYSWTPIKYDLEYKASSKNNTGLAISLFVAMDTSKQKQAIKNRERNIKYFSLDKNSLILKESTEPNATEKRCKRSI